MSRLLLFAFIISNCSCSIKYQLEHIQSMRNERIDSISDSIEKSLKEHRVRKPYHISSVMKFGNIKIVTCAKRNFRYELYLDSTNKVFQFARVVTFE